jgi:hypothetical protein
MLHLNSRVITTTPPNGDDAGAFTYTLQDSLGNALPGGTSLMLDRSLLQV